MESYSQGWKCVNSSNLGHGKRLSSCPTRFCWHNGSRRSLERSWCSYLAASLIYNSWMMMTGEWKYFNILHKSISSDGHCSINHWLTHHWSFQFDSATHLLISVHRWLVPSSESDPETLQPAKYTFRDRWISGICLSTGIDLESYRNIWFLFTNIISFSSAPKRTTYLAFQRNSGSIRGLHVLITNSDKWFDCGKGRAYYES